MKLRNRKWNKVHATDSHKSIKKFTHHICSNKRNTMLCLKDSDTKTLAGWSFLQTAEISSWTSENAFQK